MMREVIARAAERAFDDTVDNRNSDFCPKAFTDFALDAIHAAGFVIVPKEPSEAMCLAGATTPYYGGPPIAQMYRAMIAASQPELDSKP